MYPITSTCGPPRDIGGGGGEVSQTITQSKKDEPSGRMEMCVYTLREQRIKNSSL